MNQNMRVAVTLKTIILAISKISKHWIKYCTYEPYFGINFGNVKNVKKCKNVKYRWKIYIKLYRKH